MTWPIGGKKKQFKKRQRLRGEIKIGIELAAEAADGLREVASSAKNVTHDAFDIVLDLAGSTTSLSLTAGNLHYAANAFVVKKLATQNRPEHRKWAICHERNIWVRDMNEKTHTKSLEGRKRVLMNHLPHPQRIEGRKMILDESHYFQYRDISTKETTMDELHANRSRTHDIE